MTTATRRLWLYGLFLLLPALAVGGLALGLLARERARLAEREQAATESRRAAVETRARLIAENIELLLGDVQSVLMTTLLEAPADEPRPFLDEWRASNALVREVFRATADGRPVWGAGEAPLRRWLEEAAPWRDAPALLAAPAEKETAPPPAASQAVAAVTQQRSQTLSGAPMPATTSASGPAPFGPASPFVAVDGAQTAEAQARRDIVSNVGQYQRARQEIQEVAKVKNQLDVMSQNGYLNSAAPSAPMSVAVVADPASTLAVAGSTRAESFVGEFEPAETLGDESTEAGAQVIGRNGRNKIEAKAGRDARADAPVLAQAEKRVGARPLASVDGGAISTSAVSASAATAGAPPPAAFALAPTDAITRSGWTPWRDAEGLHLYGWRELPDRTVVGLELRLDAIKARLGEVFPVAIEPGEAYALRDSGGAVWHAVGDWGLPVALEVPLTAAALPGWSVSGAFAAAPASSAPTGFFALGAALIALLVGAILAAGALLVRQARASEAEAALKTSFVANVSHELKTPLTTIRLYAELLAQGRVRDETKRADYLATIGRETQRLARLVGNVLDFSRLEQGKKRYELADHDLVAALRRLSDTQAPRLVEAGLRLEFRAPGRLPIHTDIEAVEQIVLNLLDNAVKYAADGGEVTLALTAAPDDAFGAPSATASAAEREAGATGARIVVADRGPGVTPDQCERIFEKFHRVDDRLTAEKSGAGLGLSIARQLARGLGGELRCGPRVGGGAEFVLTLPATSSFA